MGFIEGPAGGGVSGHQRATFAGEHHGGYHQASITETDHLDVVAPTDGDAGVGRTEIDSQDVTHCGCLLKVRWQPRACPMCPMWPTPAAPTGGTT